MDAVNIEAEALKKQIAELMQERNDMIEDLSYLNKMCITLMSLLPEDTTPEDIRAAMQTHGGVIRK